MFQVFMLTSHLIAEGKDTYDAVYRDPARATGHVHEMTNETGLFLTAVFWYEKLAYHARKFRLLLRYYTPRYTPGRSGFVLLIPFLAGQFEEEGVEHYPNFVRRISDGEWLLVDEGQADALP